MKQNFKLIHETVFPAGTSYAKREFLINQDLINIQTTLRTRGFYMLSHEITSKTDTKAVIAVIYQ